MNTAHVDEVRLQPIRVVKGRGATSNLQGRYEAEKRERVHDGWDTEGQDWSDNARPRTEVVAEVAKSILTRNASPDIPFDVSLNPYRGCEHVMSCQDYYSFTTTKISLAHLYWKLL